MSRENCVRKAVDMIGLLHRAPRTIDELVTLTGYSKAAVTRWLRELCDEDLAKVIGTRRDRGAVGDELEAREHDLGDELSRLGRGFDARLREEAVDRGLDVREVEAGVG